MFFIGMETKVSAEEIQQSSTAESQQFELVKEQDLTTLEKIFVEYAKKNKGIYKYGTLYVIALGEQPNPGYGLRLEKQVQTWEQLHLYVKKTVPQEGIVYPAVVTYPYIAGRVNLPPYTTMSVWDIESEKPFIEKQINQLDLWDQRIITNNVKEWSITFNKPITKSLLTNYRISIQKWGVDCKEHPIQLKKDRKNKRVIKVKPLEEYEKGSIYLLYMENIKNGDIIILPFEVKE